MIARLRDDHIYYGVMQQTFDFKGLRVQMWHGDGGSNYALSYKSQNYLRALPPEERSDVLFVGHYHNKIHYEYMGTEVYHVACFEDSSEYGRRKGLWPTIGGWIIEFDVDENDDICRIRHEFLNYPRKAWTADHYLG